MYEDIIYHFSKGEDKEYRESLEMYASPIILSLLRSLDRYSRPLIYIWTLYGNQVWIFRNIQPNSSSL